MKTSLTTMMRTEKTLYMNNAIPSRLADFGMVKLNPLETDMLKIWKQKINEINGIIADVKCWKDGRLLQLFKKKDKLEEAYCRVLEGRTV